MTRKTGILFWNPHTEYPVFNDTSPVQMKSNEIRLYFRFAAEMFSDPGLSIIYYHIGVLYMDYIFIVVVTCDFGKST